MSAGGFQTYKYEMENGLITEVRLQPETQAAVIGTDGNNAEPAGEIDAGMPSAKVSLADGEIGIRPRYVIAEWEGTPPAGYDANGRIKITILSLVGKALFTKGKIVNYLGSTVKIRRAFNEQVV